MMRHLLTIGLLLSTAACTSVEELRPDMEARPLPSADSENAYTNGLRNALEVYKSDLCYDGVKMKPFRPKFVQGYPEYDVNQERRADSGCLRFKDNPTANDISVYLDNGFGLTTLYCQRFFTIATETRESRRLQRSVFKTGNVVANAVLGTLAGSTKAALAITNAAFQGVDTTYDDIDQAFLVAPTRDDLHELVFSALKKDTKAQKKAPPTTYPAAREVIEEHASICSFDGMRVLVANAIKDSSAKMQTDSTDTDQTAGGDGKPPVPPKPPAPKPPKK